MTFPEKIKIPSDDTELILISVYTTPKTAEQTATYQYTKSKYHKGILTWNEKDGNYIPVRPRIRDKLFFRFLVIK